MIAIRIQPGKYPELIGIENTLPALKWAVCGKIETHTTTLGVVISDEEGRLKGRPMCMTINGVDFVGTCLIVGQDGDEFTDIDPDSAGSFFATFVAQNTRRDNCDG